MEGGGPGPSDVEVDSGLQAPGGGGPPSAAVVVLDPDPAGSGRPAALRPILGRSPLQRHAIHLARLGVRRLVVLADGDGEGLATACRAQLADAPTGEMAVTVAAGPEEGRAALAADAGDGEGGMALRLRAEGVYDPRLYRRIARESAPAWLADSSDRQGAGVPNGPASRGRRGAGEAPGLRPIGLAAVPAERALEGPAPDARGRPLPVDEMPTYLPALRRHLRPYWVVVETDADRAWAADRIMDSAQKGILDFPARYLHPPVEDFCTRRLAPTFVTPNQITVFTGVIGFTGTWLFATGAYGLALLLALFTNVLDGVDGKLARVKLQTSRFGDRLDHTLDISFEFSWYVALGWGLAGGDASAAPFRVGLALVAVMVGCRAISGVYKLISGRQIHDHRAFDRAFRLVAGRRNIYVLVLVAGVLIGRMEATFGACLAWAAATLTVYLARTTMEGVRRLVA